MCKNINTLNLWLRTRIIIKVQKLTLIPVNYLIPRIDLDLRKKII